MSIDTSETGSLGWWIKRLAKRLADNRPRYDWQWRYFTGDPDLPEGAQNCREAYRTFQSRARSNFAELVVEATRERMRPVGFRTGADGDELGDKAAWRIWQANSLDADAKKIFRTMLATGDAYAIVGPPNEELSGHDQPIITPESPLEVVTEQHTIQKRKTVAALKMFHDEFEDRTTLYLYLLTEGTCKIWRARRDSTGKQEGDLVFDGGGWEFVDDDPQDTGKPFVPVVRFPNRADLSGDSMGEFESHRDLLDRINFVVLQRLVIVATQAFKQRAIQGNLPELDTAGNPIDYSLMFRADVGSLWNLPDEATMWESGQTDVQGILSAAKADVMDLAAVTRTPLFYLTPDAANGSAEGASLAREGLVFKTEDRISDTSEPLEQTMTYAFAYAADEERAKRSDFEVLWAPAERFSLAERFDAASKAGAAGVPWRTVMSEVLQFTPQQVDRMESERATDALLAPLLAPPPPVVTTPAG